MNACKTQLAALLVASSLILGAAVPALATGPARTTTAPLAGPSYTPAELAALNAFSSMSFAEQQTYLDGLDPSRSGRASSFHWRDAGIGGAVTLALVGLVGAAAVRVVRSRGAGTRRPAVG